MRPHPFDLGDGLWFRDGKVVGHRDGMGGTSRVTRSAGCRCHALAVRPEKPG